MGTIPFYYDEYTKYDSALYDSWLGEDSGVLVFKGIYSNTFKGTRYTFEANYVDGSTSRGVVVNEINDTSTSHVTKAEIARMPFSVLEILDTEESKKKKYNRSGIDIYGIKSNNHPQKICSLTLDPLDRNLFGRPTIYIGNKLKSGKVVDESDLDPDHRIAEYYPNGDEGLGPGTFTDTGTVQVIRLEYWSKRNTFEVKEFIGTPRQIMFWILGGFEFLKDEFTLELLERVRQDFENEISDGDQYTDGRIKPGKLWNYYWREYLLLITSLQEIELEFIDSNNSSLYMMLKSSVASIMASQNAAVRMLNKSWIRLVDAINIDYWLDLLGTKVYLNSYYINSTTTVTHIERDYVGNLLSITVESATGWPDFGFVWINSMEMIQYSSRVGNILYGIDRMVKGIRLGLLETVDNDDLGDTATITAKIRGSAIKQEPLEGVRQRLSAILAPKETETNIQHAMNKLASAYPDTSIRVFDLNGLSYQDTNNGYSAWVQYLRDVGWFVGSEGNVILDDSTCGYFENAPNRPVISFGNFTTADDVDFGSVDGVLDSKYDLAHLCTGCKVVVEYEPFSFAEGEIYYIDWYNKWLYLIDNLKDGDTVLTSSFYQKPVKVYSLETASLKIRDRDTTDKLNFDGLYLDKEPHTSGYFANSLDVDDIIYETTGNSSITDLTELEEADNTRIYNNVDKAEYTGRVLHYKTSPLVSNKLEGRFPFVVLVDDWTFSPDIISDTVDRVKSIGTTPNIVINRQVRQFRALISSDTAPFFTFRGLYVNS